MITDLSKSVICYMFADFSALYQLTKFVGCSKLKSTLQINLIKFYLHYCGWLGHGMSARCTAGPTVC